MLLSKMLGIRAKAAFGLVLLTLFILLLGGLNYLALEKLQQNADDFASTLMPAQGVVLNADRDLYQALTAQQARLMTDDSSQHDALLKDFNENADQAYERMHSFITLMAAYPQITAQLTGFDAQFTQWRTQAAQVFVLMANGDKAEAMAQYNKLAPAFSALRELYNKAGELDEAQAVALKHVSATVADSRQMWTLGILSMAVIIGLVLIYLGPKLIVDSVLSVHEKVEDISKGDGDLVTRIPVASHDELGKLAGGVNRLLDKLQGLVRELLGDIGCLEESTGGLRQISSQVDNISESQRQQLAALVTATGEISKAIHEISQHAQQTSDQTHIAQQSASEGLVLLERNVEMNRQLAASVSDAGRMVAQLESESERITSVLDVIRGIAEQTNLLALNAAIEAARAGEQGRGFAVVADEVRTLASRTQRSTEDIQQMISSLKQGVQSAVQAMDKGSGQMQVTLEMADRMRNELAGIQQMVSKVLDMNFQIASATEEQSSVMEEMNRTVSELNSLTEEAAALSGTVMQTGNDLDELAQQLAGRVRHFKV